MKILVAGDWHSELHEEAVYRALRELGHQVPTLRWHQYFVPCKGWLRPFDRIWKKAQNKYLAGPLLTRINQNLLRLVQREKPDAVFVYRGTHIFPATVRAIRESGCIVIGYNNDDPFSPKYPRWLWRHFMAAIPEYDMVLAYRQHNLDELRAAGAKRVGLLRSWYMPERNCPVQLNAEEQQRFACDVVFVGHYENDGRKELLEKIVQQGWRLKLFGPGYDWDPVIKQSPELSQFVPVKLVWGDDYNKALCGAKIALCFFSKLNRDTYTRRCFEIPATGTMMLSEHSEDLESLFRVGKEIELFSNEEEMLAKISYYLSHDSERQAMARAGLLRVQQDGHDATSRMRQLIQWITEIRGKSNV